MSSVIQVHWIESDSPLPITQVYGYCFDDSGRVLLLKDGDTFTLPGGKPEFDESIEDTLRREVLEEAQTIIDDILFIGYQRVEGDNQWFNGKPYSQLRMIARIEKMLSNAIDPATGRQYERFLYTPQQVQNTLQWGESGQAQIYAACRLATARWNINISLN